MAHRALPLLYVNMGGEMLYILSQRLKAQRIDTDKAHRGTLAGLLLRAPCLSAWPHALHDAARFQRSTRQEYTAARAGSHTAGTFGVNLELTSCLGYPCGVLN